MDLEHRKANILSNVQHASISTLIHSLATVEAENETLKARVAELKAQLSPKPSAEDKPL